MTTGVAEIVGLFLVVAGGVALTAAAVLVSVALGVAVAGALAILGGIIAVYVANELERQRAELEASERA